MRVNTPLPRAGHEDLCVARFHPDQPGQRVKARNSIFAVLYIDTALAGRLRFFHATMPITSIPIVTAAM